MLVVLHRSSLTCTRSSPSGWWPWRKAPPRPYTAPHSPGWRWSSPASRSSIRATRLADEELECRLQISKLLAENDQNIWTLILCMGLDLDVWKLHNCISPSPKNKLWREEYPHMCHTAKNLHWCFYKKTHSQISTEYLRNRIIILCLGFLQRSTLLVILWSRFIFPD